MINLLVAVIQHEQEVLAPGVRRSTGGQRKCPRHISQIFTIATAPATQARRIALMQSARQSLLVAPLAVAVVAVSSLTPPLGSQSKPAAQVFPGATWAKWDRPEDANYKPARLDAVRAWLRAGQTKALFVAADGKELFSYGDVTAASKVASVRKSVLAMLYGSYVAKGTIDLSKTVVELGLTDVQPFLEVEQSATLRHLLMARSGIYLPSGNEESRRSRPGVGRSARARTSSTRTGTSTPPAPRSNR